MTEEAAEGNESLLPPEVETAAVPVRLDTLAPWHRPRKHFVRKSQWAHYSVDLVKRVLAPNLETKVKYLTLPGLDYFDVEVIAQATRELGVKVELTAFQNQATNPSIQARCHIRTDSLVKRGLIEDTAETLPYSIEEVVYGSSQAARALRKRGPFDIINIDACGSLAHPSRDPKLIQVFHKVVEFQQNNIRRRWLLFVTFDVRQESSCREILAQLSEAISENIKSSAEFAEVYSELAQKFAWKSEKSMAEDALSRDSFIRQTSLALSKWLLHLGAEGNWDVNAKTQYCYSTDGQDPSNPTMGCLAYEFIPRDVPLQDRRNIGQPGDPSEGRPNYHVKAAQKAGQIINLDARLLNHSDLRRELAEEQLRLLELAGYTDEAQAEYRATYLT